VAVTKEEHIRKIGENTIFLDSIDNAVVGALGWSITVLFYNALHYVEAYFVTRGHGFNNHFSRASAIQNDPVIRSLYADYRDLENLSREARYDVSYFNAGDMRHATSSFELIEESIKALI
jgi:hypothetical protein